MPSRRPVRSPVRPAARGRLGTAALALATSGALVVTMAPAHGGSPSDTAPTPSATPTAPATPEPTPTATPSATPTPSPTPRASRLTKKSTKVVLGRSVQGRAIVAYRKGTPGAKHRVVLLGQIHGNERAGVTTAKAARKLAVRRDTEVWVVPTMNPDGLAANTRTNARGVDLNRNWPLNWRRSAKGLTWSGPRAASEPETRAMMRFLKKVRPTYVTSLHQPFGEVGLTTDKPRAFQRRLAKNLRLPLAEIGIGGPEPRKLTRAQEKKRGLQPGGGDNSPTLTGWYNARYPGTAITVEFVRRPRSAFVRRTAPKAILKASKVL